MILGKLDIHIYMNDAGKIGYSHLHEWYWILILHHLQKLPLIKLYSNVIAETIKFL